MSSYSTSQFKKGLKVLIDGNPCSIVENEFTKPGKGQAFNKIKVKNLIDGRVLEKTYKSGDSIPAASVVNQNMQYLYNDGSSYFFMDTQSYEQHSVSEDKLVNEKKWLVEEDICDVTVWNEVIVAIEPPVHIISQIVDTEPNLKGNTVSGGSKSATIKTGAVIRVPLFVDIGDKVKVDTRDGTYISRA